MKKLLITIVVLSCFITRSIAQPGRERLERIHAAKMAFITDRLQLTVDQSPNFIPLYKEYEKEVRETRKAFKEKYKDIYPDEADDTTSRRYIDDNLDYQEKVIAIKRRYNDRFLKIISPQQLSDLPRAEREFKRMLMRQVEEHHNNGRGRDHDRSGRGGGY